MNPTITRILVPVDFSAHSEMALCYATSLATRFGATVELLHVVEDPFISGAWSSEIYLPNLPELQDKLIGDAERRLADCRATVSEQGIPVVTTVRSGRAAQMIVEYAKALAVDLIVMGTHGRSGLPHLFMGSIAERVVRTAPCPVLTVRDTATEAQGGQSAADAAA